MSPEPNAREGESRLRFKTLCMVVLMVACATTGDLLLKQGMTQIGAVNVSSIEGVRNALVATIHSPTIWLAILFLLGFTLSYTIAVSWADYSFVMPAGAFAYALVPLCAMVFLHEGVAPLRWVGVLLICGGVLLVGQTNPNTTKQDVEP